MGTAGFFGASQVPRIRPNGSRDDGSEPGNKAAIREHVNSEFLVQSMAKAGEKRGRQTKTRLETRSSDRELATAWLEASGWRFVLDDLSCHDKSQHGCISLGESLCSAHHEFHWRRCAASSGWGASKSLEASGPQTGSARAQFHSTWRWSPRTEYQILKRSFSIGALVKINSARIAMSFTAGATPLSHQSLVLVVTFVIDVVKEQRWTG